MRDRSTWSARLLIAMVRGYRLFFSAWLGSSCRFSPTCSEYSMHALQLHGALPGVYLTASRLVRCHPWCAGGIDPVPQNAPGWFSRASSASSPAHGERAPTERRNLNP